jgi:threonine aldolase
MAITASELATQLKEFGILTGPLGSKYLRLVTHMDLTDADIEIVNKVLPDLLDRALKSK